ncbi:MAG: Creatininase [Thermoleophilia bacterium]|nr:Creatininase [Thermoleophilia bacterium]
MSAVHLAHLTWPEAEALRARDDVVGLIPTGSLEQHGPHLPLGTDFLAAEALADAIAERLPAPVVVTPVLTAGLSEHHLAFPGTVTLPEDAFRSWIDAHIAALERIGVRRVAVFSGHGGNFACIGDVAAGYAARGSAVRVIAYDDVLTFLRVMTEAARSTGVSVPETDGHAGILETSFALARFNPGLVRDFAGVEGFTGGEPGWEERMMAEGIDSLTPTGVLGDPAGASVEVGEAIFEALADELTRWIAREFDIPDG